MKFNAELSRLKLLLPLPLLLFVNDNITVHNTNPDRACVHSVF